MNSNIRFNVFFRLHIKSCKYDTIINISNEDKCLRNELFGRHKLKILIQTFKIKKILRNFFDYLIYH